MFRKQKRQQSSTQGLGAVLWWGSSLQLCNKPLENSMAETTIIFLFLSRQFGFSGDSLSLCHVASPNWAMFSRWLTFMTGKHVLTISRACWGQLTEALSFFSHRWAPGSDCLTHGGSVPKASIPQAESESCHNLLVKQSQRQETETAGLSLGGVSKSHVLKLPWRG
jgi:hypothetical protein